MVWNTAGNTLSFAPPVSQFTLSSCDCTTEYASPNLPAFSTNKKDFKNEVFFLAAVIFYVVFFWFGSRINQSKAKTWFVP
jgi:Protein of unknown function (DUF1682)